MVRDVLGDAVRVPAAVVFLVLVVEGLEATARNLGPGLCRVV